jgi:hypothetical protein
VNSLAFGEAVSRGVSTSGDSFCCSFSTVRFRVVAGLAEQSQVCHAVETTDGERNDVIVVFGALGVEEA